jgi:hypothetical protein
MPDNRDLHGAFFSPVDDHSSRRRQIGTSTMKLPPILIELGSRFEQHVERRFYDKT